MSAKAEQLGSNIRRARVRGRDCSSSMGEKGATCASWFYHDVTCCTLPLWVRQLRYRCCWLWLDAEQGILDEHLSARVRDMMSRGLLEEVRGILRKDGGGAFTAGLRQAIGEGTASGCPLRGCAVVFLPPSPLPIPRLLYLDFVPPLRSFDLL